jgi:hypothetical protein
LQRLNCIARIKDAILDVSVQEASAQEILGEHEEVMKVQHAIEGKLNLLLEKERIGLAAKKQKQIEERKQIEKQVVQTEN